MTAHHAVLMASGVAAPVFVAAFAGTNAVTVSGIQAGDMLICWAESNGGVIPALPAGFTNLQSLSSSLGMRLSYKIAVGGETSVATGAGDGAAVLQYRGSGLGVGASRLDAAGATGTVATFSALTLTGTNGRSWVSSFIASAGQSTASVPSGEIFRTTFGSFMRAWDTNGPVSSFGSRTTTMSSTVNWWTASVEITSA